jgi:hypothetical protein
MITTEIFVNCPSKVVCWPLAIMISRPYSARLLLWEFIKETVYFNNTQSFDELKHNTKQTVTNTDPETLQKVTLNMVVLEKVVDIFSICYSHSASSSELTNSVLPEPEGSSLYSQEPATSPYPEPTGSNLHSPSQSP